jgi:hypothetical protein
VPDDLEITIRSNTDKLSDRAVHDSLVNFVDAELVGGEVFLKVLVPKKTFSLEHAVSHSGPFDDGFEISGSVGIPPIAKLSDSGSFDPNSVDYPIFVDKGTGIFAEGSTTIFAKKGEFMKLPPDGLHSMYQREVKGQPGKEFMAATYGLMKGMLEINGEKFKEELKVRLMADKLI